MKKKLTTKPVKKSRGMSHFIDLSEDFPANPIQADEESHDSYQLENHNISHGAAVIETSIEHNGQNFYAPQNKEASDIPEDTPRQTPEEVKPTLEDLVDVSQIENKGDDYHDNAQPTPESRREIKRAIEFVAPAPTRTHEKQQHKNDTTFSQQALSKQDEEKTLAGSFEIPDEEKLDKGYHFYCNDRVLDKVRRYAKQKNITISKLITTILDKAIKEE